MRIKPWDVLLYRMTRPSTLYIGDGTLIARLNLGGVVYLDARDVSITPGVALNGAWEPGITKVFSEGLRKGMRVVDVGAHCGVYSVLAARAVGPSGFVTSIEPNPRLADLLAKSLAVNGAIYHSRVIMGAALDREDRVRLGFPTSLSGSASILMAGEAEGRETFDAAARPLDCWLGPDLRVDVLKIDAEGAESLIWDGARQILAQNRTLKIYMEFSPPMLSSLCDPGAFLQQIRREGFDIATLDVVTGRMREVPDATLLQTSWSELLLTRA